MWQGFQQLSDRVKAEAQANAGGQTSPPEQEPASGIPLPKGAKWCDVTIRFLNGDTVRVRVRGKERLHTCAEMGMADARNKTPSDRWTLLTEFAEGNGMIECRSVSSKQRPAWNKRRQRLAHDLKRFFGISGSPIIPIDEDGKDISGKKKFGKDIQGYAWQTVFALLDESATPTRRSKM